MIIATVKELTVRGDAGSLGQHRGPQAERPGWSSTTGAGPTSPSEEAEALVRGYPRWQQPWLPTES
jgi:hypothetical protein